MTIILPKVSKKPFHLDGSKMQVLLLHGYTGSPYDLRPLGNFLHSHGVEVYAPLLKGHGSDPKELFDVTAEDWVSEALEAVSSFNEERPIIIAGLSMGALLSILLASEDRRVDGLVLLSPALRLSTLGEAAIISAYLGLIPKTVSLKKFSGGSDIMDAKAKKKTPSYKEMPVSGLLEFDRIRRLASDRIEQVTCPIFLGFGQQDGTIDINECDRMMLDKAKTKIISKFYDNSKHVVSLDFAKEELFLDIWHFLTKTLGL